MTSQMSNEQLCIAALDGNMEARSALVENNLRFIKRTAYEMWSAQRELNATLCIEINDLVQEGSLGLLDCIGGYNTDTGNKFLTYAAPAIHNAMVDCIRRWNPTFETKNLGSIIRLDEVVKDENKGKHEFIADSRTKNPEQIYISQKKPTKKSIPHCNELTAGNRHTYGIASVLRMIHTIH